MHFTREPIIETVITPKEGFKLLVRNSKGIGQEEYLIDAVEVVSFGKAHFFRSKEQAKVFLLPVSDYEVLEFRETKIALKNVTIEKNIKISGGREPALEGEGENFDDKNRRKKRKRKPHPSNMKGDQERPQEPPVLRKIIPPPNMLIKERLSHVKPEEIIDDTIFPAEQEDLAFDEHELPSTPETPPKDTP